MSACLTGTQPSSGVRDSMDVLNRLVQGWGMGRGWGRSCVCQESRWWGQWPGGKCINYSPGASQLC